MKVFFDLACMTTCCWVPKTKYESFITHNRGTLTAFVIHFNQIGKNRYWLLQNKFCVYTFLLAGKQSTVIDVTFVRVYLFPHGEVVISID